jgi:hypothetical protein
LAAPSGSEHELERGWDQIDEVSGNHVPDRRSAVLFDLDSRVAERVVRGDHLVQDPVVLAHECPDPETAFGGGVNAG